MSLSQEWYELLKPAFQNIQEALFPNDFTVTPKENNTIEFGDKENQYKLYVTERMVLQVSKGILQEADEIVQKSGEIIANHLKQEEICAIVFAKGNFATDERAEHVLSLQKYAVEHLFRNRTLRMPLYSIIPSLCPLDAVLVHAEGDYSTFFYSIPELETLALQEKEEEAKMIKVEEELDTYIRNNISNVRTIENKKMLDVSYLNDEGFFTKFSFTKRYRNSKSIFAVSYAIHNDWHQYEHESIEHVLDYTKQTIEGMVSDFLKINQ